VWAREREEKKREDVVCAKEKAEAALYLGLIQHAEERSTKKDGGQRRTKEVRWEDMREAHNERRHSPI